MLRIINCLDCQTVVEAHHCKTKRCKVCQKKYIKIVISDYNKKWRLNHLKEAQEKLKRWQQTNPDKVAILNKKWRLENPEKSLIAKRKSRNGMTDDQFQSMLQKQNNCCAICLKFFINTPRVDHDHACCSGGKDVRSCGKCNRGLLCHLCNVMLGNAKDDPEILERAAAYLRQFKEKKDPEGSES